MLITIWFFFFQAEDGIRDLVRSRGLGDVYKRQQQGLVPPSDTVNELREQLLSATETDDKGQRSLKILSLIHI